MGGVKEKEQGAEMEGEKEGRSDTSPQLGEKRLVDWCRESKWGTEILKIRA